VRAVRRSPVDNSAVDGYAVANDDIPGERWRDLEVVADLPAGSVFDGALARGQAIRIMTGAPLPAGAGTVYPQEIVERAGDRVRIGALAPGVNVRRRGEDVASGAVVIEAGTVLRPQEVGLAASLGLCQITVHARPRVALLSTGDEVAEPGTARKPGQIYDANRFALCGSVEQCGGAVIDLGIVPDRREELRARLLEAADMADIVITSGGVSVGAYDLVKEVLGEIGGIDFWQVAMQPAAARRALGRAHSSAARKSRRLDAHVSSSCGRRSTRWPVGLASCPISIPRARPRRCPSGPGAASSSAVS
jgi:molybdopterin molybdotransferase